MENQTIALVSLALGWTVHVAALVWWFSVQFARIRDVINVTSTALTKKMTDHELADEKRFGAIEARLPLTHRAHG